jgi:LPXTG-site transpeptidase (sortase) family protein
MYFPPPPPFSGVIPANDYGIVRMSAPRLGVDHYVEILGVTEGAMDSPNDGSYAVGYYPDFSQVPGESGNAVFSAHETWNHQQGPFYQMHKAKAGDEIFVEMADGTRLRYVVMSNTRYDINTIPMGEVVWPSKRAFGEQWLTLITCGGRIVYDSTGFGEYLDRDVIIAKRAGA